MNIEPINIEDIVSVESELSITNIDFMASGDQYLTFILGSENYGVDILSVNEIRGWEKPTPIPHAPDYVKGVINIRGTIVPVIDLRVKFTIGKESYNPTTVVILLAIKKDNQDRILGFVVDAVSDVLNADEEKIMGNSMLSGSVPSHYIKGLVNMGKQVVTLLNANKLVAVE